MTGKVRTVADEVHGLLELGLGVAHGAVVWDSCAWRSTGEEGCVFFALEWESGTAEPSEEVAITHKATAQQFVGETQHKPSSLTLTALPLHLL